MKNTILVVLSLFSFATFSQVKKSKEINEKKIEVVEIKKMDSNEPVMDIGPARFEEPQDQNIIYTTSAVDLPPQYPGGTAAFFKFIGMNFRYPEDPEFTGGKMMVLFIVEKDGNLSDIKAVKGLGFGTEQEIVRVLKMSPRWNAAMKNGEKVRVSYTIPITLYGAK